MTALWILLGIIAFFWLILALPLRIFLSYEGEDLKIRLKYALIPLFDSEAPEKPKKPKKEKKKPEQEKKKKPGKKKKSLVGPIMELLGLPELSSAAGVRNSLRTVGPVGIISAVGAALKRIFKRIFRLLKKGVFKKFDLRISVGSEDPADAALLYGQVCSALFPVMSLLENSMKFKNRRTDVRCDEDREDTEIRFDCQLNYRPWHFVCFAFWFAGNYIKSTVKKEN